MVVIAVNRYIYLLALLVEISSFDSLESRMATIDDGENVFCWLLTMHGNLSLGIFPEGVSSMARRFLLLLELLSIQNLEYGELPLQSEALALSWIEF